jgi:DNA-binding transcriptional regulator YhcF (GntR family)
LHRERLAAGYQQENEAMSADEFEARLEKLITEAREAGMSDEAIIDVLHDAAEGLHEGL